MGRTLGRGVAPVVFRTDVWRVIDAGGYTADDAHAVASYGGPKRVVVFEKSDHSVYAERPDRLAREMRRFVDGSPR